MAKAGKVEQDDELKGLPRQAKTGKARKREPATTLSSIIPELACFDDGPDEHCLPNLVGIASIIADYVVRNKPPYKQREKIKNLFLSEVGYSTLLVQDFLNKLAHITQDNKSYWHKKWIASLEETKRRLWAVLDQNEHNPRFNDLIHEQMEIVKGVSFDSRAMMQRGADGVWRGRYVFKKTREETKIPPIDPTGWWQIKGGSLEKLRRIDSNDNRDGIKGDKKCLNRLKEFLRNRHHHPDIAATLYLEDGRIKTTMLPRSMFLQK